MFDFIKNRFQKLNRIHVLKKGDAIPGWILPFKRIVYLLAFAALIFIMIEAGLRWQLSPPLKQAFVILEILVLVFFMADIGITFYFTYPKKEYIKHNYLDLIILLPFLFNLISLQAGAGLIAFRNVIILIQMFSRSRKFSKLLRNITLNTAQIVAISFIVTILVGTVLLTFPSATEDGKGASFADALFTATSATCVTGLIVQDTPSYFSTFGEWVILCLIQLGGLGIMTYSVFIALILGRYSLGQRKLVQDMFEEERNVMNMVIDIFKMTFVLELIGFLLLFLRWVFYFPNIQTALYQSLFHSVSAFCNAGFSLFSDSLMQFSGDAAVNLIVILLIFFGGTGFIAYYDLLEKFKRSDKRLSPYTKIVLWVSAAGIILGFFVVFFMEYDKSLVQNSIIQKCWIALFQSVTTRTAGFNTVDIGSLSRITLTIMMILMFIGASPGSTGGGIKTTTLAMVLLSIRSVLSGKDEIEIFKRSVPSATVNKAIAIFIAALILVLLFFILLMAVEDKPFLDLLFETISAFGTVGLSTGITPDLTVPGKLLITLLMYLGRIGPLTMVLALTSKIRTQRLRYPTARIMIG